MSKKVFVMLLILLQLFMLTGCFDYVEYEKLAIVGIVGIDYDKLSGETTVTVQLVSTRKGGSTTEGAGGSGSDGASEIKPQIYSFTDLSLVDAVAGLQKQIPKKLFFSFTESVILGEDATRFDMKEIEQVFHHTSVLRMTSSLFVVEGKASQIMQNKGITIYHIASNYVSELANIEDLNGITTKTDVIGYLIQNTTPGIVPTVARIVPLSQTQGNQEEGKPTIKVSGIAVFKEHKLLGWLDEKESMGWRWVTGKEMRIYKTSNPGEKESPVKLSFKIQSASSKMNINIKNNRDIPEVNLKIKVQGTLVKFFSNKSKVLIGSDEISIVENELENSIKSDIEASIKKAQKELKADVFGFGYKLFRQHPYLWRNRYSSAWDEIYPNLPVHVEVVADIINTGASISEL